MSEWIYFLFFGNSNENFGYNSAPPAARPT